MVDVRKYQGLAQFGPAYRVMLENDAHAPGSVDRVLMENMVRLCAETVDYLYSGYSPITSLYREGERPGLEQCTEKILRGHHRDEERIEAIACFTGDLQLRASQDLDSLQIGGTEEEIIARGCDWCADVARVNCVLCQVAGFPARIVYLADAGRAYSGHVVTEVYRCGVWGTVDPLVNLVYRHSAGNPASTWDLMNDTDLIEQHFRGESTPYTTSGQFRAAAISNYFVWKWKDYDYAVARINHYYRSILEMSGRGWPGGLRWLHGEDR